MNIFDAMFFHPRGLWGRLGGWLMARSNRVMVGDVVALLNLQPEHTVLEIGFGPGLGLEAGAAQVTSGRVVGIDPSEAMHRQAASRNLAAIRDGKVQLHVGGVSKLPFPDASFDAAFSTNTIQLWPNPQDDLKEVLRVLRPNGVFVAALSPRARPRMSAARIEELMRTAGFEEVKSLTLPSVRAGAFGRRPG